MIAELTKLEKFIVIAHIYGALFTPFLMSELGQLSEAAAIASSECCSTSSGYYDTSGSGHYLLLTTHTCTSEEYSQDFDQGGAEV